MRVVFMGTPEFAVPSLQALASEHEVLTVYTRPDKPRGRGRTPVPSPVKSAALDLGLPVRQPDTLRDAAAVELLVSDGPDVICVAAFGMILPPEILGIPRFGCLNVHASLLPEYRGAAPIQRAILDGAQSTGVSIMQMEEGLDTGPYSLVYTTEVDDKSLTELEAELAARGADLLVQALARLEAGDLEWHEQDPARATYAPKIGPEDVALSPDLDVETALRRIRASSRSARSKLRVGECVLDVTDAGRADVALEKGTLRSTKDVLALGLSDGTIEVREVRPQGKACMHGCAWARGARVPETCTWDAV